MILICCIAFIWGILSGQGAFISQTHDWVKHNAILRDLIQYSWPVRYILSDGTYAMLSYYIAEYLLPAAVGKLFGFRVAEIALMIQVYIGLILVFFNIIETLQIKEIKKQLTACLIFILFGGTAHLNKWLYGMIMPFDASESSHYL